MNRSDSFTSIRFRLPAAISVALTAILITLGVVLQHGLERILVSSAEERLEEVVVELVQLLDGSAAGLRNTLDSLASDPALRAALAAPETDRAVLTAAMQALAPISASSRIFQITDASGTCLVAIETDDERGHPRPDGCVARTTAPGPDRALVGAIYLDGDSLFTDVVTRIPEATPLNEPVEVTWRIRIASEGAVDLIASLIADDAAMLIGSMGGEWTDDLVTPYGEYAASELGEGAHEFEDARGERIAVAQAVPNADWIVSIDRSRDAVLAPASTFLIPIGIAIAVGLLAAVLMTSWVTGRVTSPLRTLTAAASEMSTGHLDVRVHLDRSDEIGMLGSAFNSMAEVIDASHHALESRVADRTAELEETLRRLKAAQTELVRKEKLAVLGGLAGGVGHELRNPLGVIANTVYLLERLLKDQPEKIQSYIGMLDDQVVIATRIVDDLLAFGRVRPAARETFELAPVIRSEIDRIAQRPDTVRIEVDTSGATHALADPGQVRPVLFNLITNAVQALGESGEITVRTGQDEDGIWLEVADDGEGVPMNVRDDVFEPLVTSRSGGIGMGLALSRTLARNNGGDLTLEPSDVGARFRLTLPAPSIVAVA